MDLESLLSPMSLATFRDEYLGRQWLKWHRDAEDILRLLSWSALQTFLETSEVTERRVRIVKCGADVDTSEYWLAPPKAKASRIDVERVASLMESGATLIVNAIDTAVTALGRLAESIERASEVRVQANAYGSLRAVPGFGIHWDDHDTLVIQLAGRKRWRLWTPTLDSPLPGMIVPTPTGAPLWEGELIPGDVLYLPRGWWHDVCAVNEATLHVTIGIPLITGADILRGLVPKLTNHAIVRRSVLPWVSPDQLHDYFQELGGVLAQSVADLGPGDLPGFRPRLHRRSWPPKLPPVATTNRVSTRYRLMNSQVPVWSEVNGRGDIDIRVGRFVATWPGSWKGMVVTLASAKEVERDDLLNQVPVDERGRASRSLQAMCVAGVMRAIGDSQESRL